jgi:exopolysaccharide biosynthesis protein
LKQEINILEIDTRDASVEVAPVLSHDLVYGFENLSTMVKRANAYAAVNGGFFSQYGIPSGLVAIQNEIVSATNSKYPVFSYSSGKALLSDLRMNIWLEAGDKKIRIDKVNVPGEKGSITLFSQYYGTSTRADSKNRSITLINGKITDNSLYPAEATIPEKGFLLTGYGDNAALKELKTGQSAVIKYEPDLSQIENAYQCGSWIVKNGDIVIGPSDPWIGVTTNRDPRTAIGIRTKIQLCF